MMYIDEISRLLPQRPPFLMVDRVISFEVGKRLVALKNVTINDETLSAHFPGNAVMPGALIIEAMAQTALLLSLSLNNFQVNKANRFYLGSVKASFFKLVIPGDQLKLEAGVIKMFSNGLCVEVKAHVNDDKVAESELICMIEK